MDRSEKILIVEDKPAVCRQIEERFNCDCATDGWDAIEKLETQEYDAIVIDTEVPRHSGFGVLTYLREARTDLGNVILLTNASERADVQRKLGSGCNVVDRADVVSEIKRILDS